MKPHINNMTLLTFAIAIAFTACETKAAPTTEAKEADKKAGIEAPSIEEVKAIAEEGFIYGLPIVMNYTVNYEFWVDRTSGQYKSGFNELVNERRVFTYEDTAVVTPNSDTPYSFACLDLRAEPFVVSVPAVEKARYFSLQFVDWNTFNYGYVGSRATGNEAGDYLVVGPDWKGATPAGIKGVLQPSTQFTIVLFRTQLFGADDMPNVIKIQDGYKIQPLSTYLKQPAPPAAPKLDFPMASAELAKTNFFEYLDFALQFAPAGPEEKEIRAKLAKIGIGPGKTFEFKDLSLEHKAAVLIGMKEGEKKVEEKVSAIGKKVNGWSIASAFGNREFYNGDWLLRAAGAKAGIYGNDAVEAVYPIIKTLPDGELLDGSKSNYTLTFPAGQLPPVNAFWSVTMYDGKTQLLIKNPINRYLINSPMLPEMKKNADGSLTLYIQKDSPGADKQSNWLPAPSDPIYMVMRLYWPKTEAPSILPPGEGTWAPPGIQKAATNKVSVDEAKQIAVDAYIYGYSLITTNVTRVQMTNVSAVEELRGPANNFINVKRYPPADYRGVSAPNADTLYSVAWLDLGKEPIVFTYPDMGQRYFLFPMYSMQMNVVQSLGSRTTGGKAGTFLVTGPGWNGEVPEGMQQVKSPSKYMLILGRTYADGSEQDYGIVNGLQAQYKLTPLSAWGKDDTYQSPPVNPDPGFSMSDEPQKVILDMGVEGYFNMMAELLGGVAPPSKADAPILAEMAKLGIVPGQKFEMSKLDPAVQAAIKDVPQVALEKIEANKPSVGVVVDGWIITKGLGDYGTDYLKRAVVAAFGWGANLQLDAVYPNTEVDSNGEALTGANKYTLTFAKGQTPPVDGFWSLTMYEVDKGWWFVPNELNKFTVSPRNNLKYTADGSLTLYLQSQSPGEEKEANWLPAPKGAFVPMLRMYWPKATPPSIIDGTWKVPAVEKVK